MLKSIPKTFKLLAIACVLCAIAIPVFFFFHKKEVIECPFSNLSWDATEQDVFDTEGSYLSSYASTYGGLTYTYPKDYLGYSGTIKYMFDEEGTLAGVAWAYESDHAEELSSLYKEICNGIQELYGESDYHTENMTNYGDVWKKKEGHIILSALTLGDNTALQVAYVYPTDQE